MESVEKASGLKSKGDGGRSPSFAVSDCGNDEPGVSFSSLEGRVEDGTGDVECTPFPS